MSDYKIINDNVVLRLADNANIPIAVGNADYQSYAAWLAEGNTPLPADAPVITVPATVTNAQARAIMRQTFPVILGGSTSLFTAVDTALRAAKDAAKTLPDNDHAHIEADTRWNFWEQANEFERNGTLVQAIAAQFGMDAAAIDALFIAAAQVTA